MKTILLVFVSAAGLYAQCGVTTQNPVSHILDCLGANGQGALNPSAASAGAVTSLTINTSALRAANTQSMLVQCWTGTTTFAPVTITSLNPVTVTSSIVTVVTPNFTSTANVYCTASSNSGAGPTGPVGATGPTGATGAGGPTGVTGPSGPAGTAGSAGATGATGPSGSNGSNGATGATGPTGATGAAGTTNPMGAYSALTTYAQGDLVTDVSILYVSLAGSNLNHTPASSPTWWSPQAGSPGPTGATGPSGPAGSAGSAGPTGATGPSGTAGSAGATGATGPAGAAGPTGPSGANGANGATGATGPSGPSGPTGGSITGTLAVTSGSLATITHNLGTQYVVYSIRDNSTNEQVIIDPTFTTNTITFTPTITQTIAWVVSTGGVGPAGPSGPAGGGGSGMVTCAPAGGSATAYTCTTQPSATTSCVEGTSINFYPDVANSAGAVTLNPGCGVTNILIAPSSTNPLASTFLAGASYLLVYHGTTFQFTPNNYDPTKSGVTLMNGVTSGGIAWSVRDVGGTLATVYMPTNTTSSSTGYALLIGGTVTCDSGLPSWAPSTCYTSSWAGAGGDLSGTLASATVAKVNNASVPASSPFVGTNASSQLILSSPFTTNAQTATYQVLAADFSAYKTITVASGTFTITLVASGAQPATGQSIRVVNYGSGIVTIARSGQNINGGTGSLSLAAASSTAPTSAWITSDGSNYFASTAGGSPGTTYYQTVKSDSTTMTQRSILNLKAGSNITLTPTDNSGANSSEVTIASTGGGSGFTCLGTTESTLIPGAPFQLGAVGAYPSSGQAIVTSGGTDVTLVTAVDIPCAFNASKFGISVTVAGNAGCHASFGLYDSTKTLAWYSGVMTDATAQSCATIGTKVFSASTTPVATGLSSSLPAGTYYLAWTTDANANPMKVVALTMETGADVTTGALFAAVVPDFSGTLTGGQSTTGGALNGTFTTGTGWTASKVPPVMMVAGK